MDAAVISALGGLYLTTGHSDISSDASHSERMSWAIEHILGDLADEYASTSEKIGESAATRQLIGFGVDFALEATDIIRTKPGPLAIAELRDLVSRWKSELGADCDRARKEAAKYQPAQ
ncbi:MAG TPA: hypothetical protein VHX17_12755 [Candidatus Cybelea sp.]|jgi:hypothetical protein|nr:hypothetical protein [Candidatus Cybelea sp.]